MTKELSHVMLKLHNVRMEPSNVRKKLRKSPNVTKELLHVMLKLYNVMMELSNILINKKTTKCDKSTIKYDVGTAQCEDGTVKCKKKVRELPNVRKNCHM